MVAEPGAVPVARSIRTGLGMGAPTSAVRFCRGRALDGHGPADPVERQPAQTSASSAGTVVARPSSLRAATDSFGSMPVNAES